MEITGKIKVTKNSLPKLKGMWLQGASYAIYREGQETIADAKQNYVPVETGALKASGFCDEPHTTGTRCTVNLGFGKAGSPAEPYAKIVHERPPSIGQGKNKYLERPMLKRKAGLEDRVGKMFQQWLKGRIP